jgi:hypothetical protein
MGTVAGTCFEMHGSDTYMAPLRERLIGLGATVREPFARLGRAERLAWYDARVGPAEAKRAPGPELSEEVLLGLIESVADPTQAVTVETLEALDPGELARPGLYAWFVDADGAVELSAGAGHVVRSGLVYAGVAGGSGRSTGSRTDTLRGRLLEVHLAPNSRVSTFRHTLAAALRPVYGWDTVDEVALTHWMGQHLTVLTLPVDDPETLDLADTAVLGALDPPLNLAKVPRTPLRLRLLELRRAV